MNLKLRMGDVNVGLSKVGELKVEEGAVDWCIPHFGGFDPR